jgi:hypothetical protein
MLTPKRLLFRSRFDLDDRHGRRDTRGDGLDNDENCAGHDKRDLPAHGHYTLRSGQSCIVALWSKAECQIQSWTRENALPDRPALPKLAGLEAEIMLYITNLSNYVLATKASQHLKRQVQFSAPRHRIDGSHSRIRARHPKYFASVSLYHRALRMISTNHYLPPVRGFILDLFDIQLTPDVLARLRRLEAAVEDPNATYTSTAGAGTRTASPLKVDGLRPHSRSLHGTGLAPLTPQHEPKTTSPEPYSDHALEDAGSPRRSTDSASRGTIDPHEYRRRATSSPGPASPSRSYSDTGVRGQATGGSGLGARMRGLTISTMPSGNDGMFN